MATWSNSNGKTCRPAIFSISSFAYLPIDIRVHPLQSMIPSQPLSILLRWGSTTVFQDAFVERRTIAEPVECEVFQLIRESKETSVALCRRCGADPVRVRQLISPAPIILAYTNYFQEADLNCSHWFQTTKCWFRDANLPALWDAH